MRIKKFMLGGRGHQISLAIGQALPGAPELVSDIRRRTLCIYKLWKLWLALSLLGLRVYPNQLQACSFGTAENSRKKEIMKKYFFKPISPQHNK
jgi:hypothetical protein